MMFGKRMWWRFYYCLERSVVFAFFFFSKARWECHNQFNSTSKIDQTGCGCDGRGASFDQDGLLLDPTSSYSFI